MIYLWLFLCGGQILDAEIRRVFPNESEMDAGDFFLTRPLALGIVDSHLFVLDSGEHRVFVFHVDGTYQFGFGKRGEQSGALKNPTALSVGAQGIWVLDQEVRFQLFDKRGRLLDHFESVDPCLAFIEHQGRIFGLFQGQRLGFYFATLSQTGRRKQTMKLSSESSLTDFGNDQEVIFQKSGARILSLQRFGQEYRIFSSNGTESIGSLGFRPDEQKDFAKIGLRHQFSAILNFGDGFLASYPARGGLPLVSLQPPLSATDAAIFRLSLPQQVEKSQYRVADMVWEKTGKEEVLFLALSRPKPVVIKLKLSLKKANP